MWSIDTHGLGQQAEAVHLVCSLASRGIELGPLAHLEELSTQLWLTFPVE
jgi:hypothetical protein